MLVKSHHHTASGQMKAWDSPSCSECHLYTNKRLCSSKWSSVGDETKLRKLRFKFRDVQLKVYSIVNFILFISLNFRTDKRCFVWFNCFVVSVQTGFAFRPLFVFGTSRWFRWNWCDPWPNFKEILLNSTADVFICQSSWRTYTIGAIILEIWP
jgi:hypothetical protein